MYYVIKVQIKGITKPPVWRRFHVSPEARLSDFHEAIQAAFHWGNYHLHSFEQHSAGWSTEYTSEDVDPWSVPEPNLTIRELFSLLPSPVYVYDFGDWWEHSLKIEKIEEGDVPGGIDCVAGRGAGPVEDSGGPWGYQELKRVMASDDPKDAEAKQQYLDTMVGADFDPKECEFPSR